MTENQSVKITEKDSYISLKLLEQIVKETNISKKIIEETNSELWYETINGSGKLFFHNNVTYSGNVRYGVLESGPENIPGILTFADGTKYEGEIHNNKITGQGILTFPTGAIYTGELLNGLRNGYGIYQSPEGIKYEGNWKRGLKHGFGKMERPNMFYEGEWKTGYIEGQGKLKWENGNVYEGQFKHNKINGNGYIIWYELSEKYTGEWSDNFQNGMGMHTWYEPKGEQKYLRNRYVGEWIKGIRAGYGVFFYSNGARYEGSWKENYKNGFGVYTYQDGSQYIGRFHKDRPLDNLNQISIEKIDEMIANNQNFIIADTMNNQIITNNSNMGGISNPNTRTIPKGKAGVGEGGNAQNQPFQRIQEKKEEERNKKTYSQQRSVATASREEELNKDNSALNILNKELLNSKDKSLNKFHTLFDISDIVLYDPQVESELKEIENILLRSLSEIRHCYYFILKGDKDSDDLNISKFEQKDRMKDKDREKDRQNQNQQNKIIECINNNDISFCLEMKELWRYMREIGLIDAGFTIAEFDRSFAKGSKNIFEIYQIPESLEGQEIYDYLYSCITKSKYDFVYKYSKYIELYYKNEKSDKETSPFYLSNVFLNNFSSVKESFKQIDYSYHFKSRLILLREFHEILIRVAFMKYLSVPNKTLAQKLQSTISIFTASQKTKRVKASRSNYSKNELSFTAEAKETKNKNIEKNAIDECIYTNEKLLKKKFKEIYYLQTAFPNNKDITISYGFFYKKVIKKSKQLNDLVGEKLKFVEIICNYHKEKTIYTIDDINNNPTEVFKYIEQLFGLELIYFEFCELIFLLGRKYMIKNHLPEQNKNYTDVLRFIEEALKTQKGYWKKQSYIYPSLPAHEKKQKLIEEEMARIIAEKLYQKEVARYMNERTKMDQNKDNAYIEENYEDEEEESYESNN